MSKLDEGVREDRRAGGRKEEEARSKRGEGGRVVGFLLWSWEEFGRVGRKARYM